MSRFTDFFTLTPLLPVAACLMAGIAVGGWLGPAFPLPLALLGAVAVAFACWRWPLVQTGAILACCVVAGMALEQVQGAGAETDTDWGRWHDGVVVSEPARRPKTVGMDILVPELGRSLRCYLSKDSRSHSLHVGDGVVLRLRAGDAGGGTYVFVRSSDWRRGGMARARLSLWQRSRLWFLMQRSRLLGRYRELDAPGDAYAVLAAMTLGDKSAQTAGLRQTYAMSGASHVLAISGLHVGIVYMLLTWLILGHRRYWFLQALTVAAIWCFALLTGLSASVTRAATMISVYALFAQRGGRVQHVNVLCFAAIVMLVANAHVLFDVGFQLSFAAVFAILTLMPLLQSLYQPRNRVLRKVWGLLLVSLCAQVGTAPLVAYYFGRLPMYFLLTNLIVIPAASLILYGSLLFMLFPPAGLVLVWVVRGMNACLRLIAALPGASMEGLHPTPVQVALVYVLIVIAAFLLNIIKKYAAIREKQLSLQNIY